MVTSCIPREFLHDILPPKYFVSHYISVINAKRFTEIPFPFVMDALECVAHTDARDEGRELATDNAVSALGNLLEAQRDCLSKPGSGVGGADGVGQAWCLWLEYMPLGADEEEAEKVGRPSFSPFFVWRE